MQAVDVESISIAVMAAGGIVFFGALYAVFYTLGRLGRNQRLVLIGYAGYAALSSCVWLLAHSLHLSGGWLSLVACLLIGYLIAPPLIWRLTLAIHSAETSHQSIEVKRHE